MNESKVVLIRCETYDDDAVYDAVKRGVDLLGGIAKFVRPGEKILLKPNVLAGSPPEKCVTTHPAVFKAVGRLLKAKDVKLYYGDSPGIGSIEGTLRRAGLKAVADDLGIILADFNSGRPVHHPKALQNKVLTIAHGALESDGLISLPKFKTHGLTRFTGAVKNQFGCVPGILKAQYHLKLADAYQFGTLLADINTLLKPRLYVMDGIMAMEGNGPRNGHPRAMNVLLFSSDPVALDAIACKIIDMNPEFVPTSQPGERSGLGNDRFENIEVAGDPLDSFVAEDFDIVRRPPDVAAPRGILALIKNQVTSRPVIDHVKCTGCGICIKACPVGTKALTWDERNSKIPKHFYKHCIRCYCCQEMCPEGAITVETPLLSRLIFRG
ncbi:MAG: DUF362 domain-containing protein [Deltaproteobacteria bacterium]|nr:DUF362 domain-containing protein [Deltaproteobacteria bacterium]